MCSKRRLSRAPCGCLRHDAIAMSGALHVHNDDRKACLRQWFLAPGLQCQASEPGLRDSAGPPPLLQDALTS